MKKKNGILICLLALAGMLMVFTNSCKQDTNNNATPPVGTVTDVDGNIYQTITIGTQVWMAENLKTTKYRNNDPIPNVADETQWTNLTTGGLCSFNNDAAFGNKYGKLYNWYTVNDSRKLAPIGWHIASDAEWTTLESYISTHLGTSGSISKALAAKTDWASTTDAGTVGNDLTKNNASGFTALPGGSRGNAGAFGIIGSFGYWWTSSEYDSGTSWSHYMFNSGDIVIRSHLGLKNAGFSVRCVKD